MNKAPFFLAKKKKTPITFPYQKKRSSAHGKTFLVSFKSTFCRLYVFY